MTVKQRLIQLRLPLPEVAGPFGAYVPAKRVGDTLHVAGQLPIEGRGAAARRARGRGAGDVGGGVRWRTRGRAARQCVVNALAAADTVSGGRQPARRRGDASRVYVACGPDFTGQSARSPTPPASCSTRSSATRASTPRAAVGVAALPKGAAVEVEVTFACKPEGEKNYMVFDAENDAPNPPSLGPDKPEKI